MFSANLNPVSAISNVIAIANTSTIPFNGYHSVEVKFDSLGIPSCALISVVADKIITIFGSIGTYSQCLSYAGFKYLGDYNIESQIWKLNATQLTNLGPNQFVITIRNSISAVTVYTNVTVSNSPCTTPILEIKNQASNFFSPAVYTRSNLFSLLSNTTVYSCCGKLDNFKTWLVYKADPLSGKLLTQVNLTNNPTVNFAQIVIKPNTLNYGLYSFVYQVTMTGGPEPFINQIQSFVQIVPTGFVVFTFPNGMAEITRGMNQIINLNPVQYSYDKDNLTPAKSLNFKFYCQILDQGVQKGFPMLSSTKMIDLMMFKTNSTYAARMSNATTCFNTPSNI